MLPGRKLMYGPILINRMAVVVKKDTQETICLCPTTYHLEETIRGFNPADFEVLWFTVDNMRVNRNLMREALA